MMQTIILNTARDRANAHELIDRAPNGYVCKIGQIKRNLEQNARMWAMLSEISRAKPDGLMHTPEAWKSLFMHACGHATAFEMGLNGEPFPIGFRSSQLTVSQMSDLMEFMSAWASEKGVKFNDISEACPKT